MRAVFAPKRNRKGYNPRKRQTFTLVELRSLDMERTSVCWCGHTTLLPFSEAYFRCPSCETLLVAAMPSAEELAVTSDDQDLYGKHYFHRLESQYGHPSLQTRMRSDMTERCIYWLRGLLRYKLPPARVLELGCAHGAFVALMRWAGYEATGLDVSPGTTEMAQRTF